MSEYVESFGARHWYHLWIKRLEECQRLRAQVESLERTNVATHETAELCKHDWAFNQSQDQFECLKCSAVRVIDFGQFRREWKPVPANARAAASAQTDEVVSCANDAAWWQRYVSALSGVAAHDPVEAA